MVAGKHTYDHYFTISNAFEGTVTVSGKYYVLDQITDYSLEISVIDPTAAPAGIMTLAADGLSATMTMPAYDGTVRSDAFTLAEAYDLTLSPAQHDKLQSVTVDGTAVSADQNGTITGIEPGQKVVITAKGNGDYIIRKAAVKKGAASAEQAGETLTWDNTNAFVEANQNVKISKFNANPFTCEGVSISFTGSTDDAASYFKPYDEYDKAARLYVSPNGGEFTFTAPTGKQFTMIEITNNNVNDFTAYGDWTKDETNNKAVWSGTASSTVTMTGYNYNSQSLSKIQSIVFTVADANN